MAATKDVSATGRKNSAGAGKGDKADVIGGKREPATKPDNKLYEAKIAEERKAIEEIKLKLNELRSKIDTSTSGREEFHRKQIEIRERLNKLQEKSDKLEKERKELFDQIDAKNKEGKEMRQNVQNLKKSIGFSSEDDIDKKIQEIESLMITSTISLKEEKKLMQQIAMLKSNKPLIGKYTSMESNAHQFEDNSILPLRGRLGKLKEELNLLRNDRREESEKYRNLMNKRNTEMSSVKHLFDEKNELTKQLATHNEKLRSIQDDLYKEMEKYNSYIKYITSLKSKQYEEERRKKAVENERVMLVRELEKVEELGMDESSTLLQQTIQYVQKLIDEKQSNKNITEIDNHNDETLLNDNKDDNCGGVAVLPKKDRKEEFLVMPKMKKNKKVGGGKQKEKSRSLKLDIGVLSIFEECGVSAPVSVDDLENCLSELKEKLEEMQKKQKKKMDEAQEKIKIIQAQLDALDAKAATTNASKNAHENQINVEVNGEE